MNQQFLSRLLGLCLALGLGAACGESPTGPDALYEGFQNPPAAARPFVRWWWNGNRVNAREALRELDVLAEAGVGGVEINAIAMPQAAAGDLDAIAPALDWLSPEWNQVVKATAEGAKARGLLADLIIGSGWPFGGRFLEPGEMLQIITVQKHRIQGPGTFTKPLADLTTGTFRTWDPVRREDIHTGSTPELLFLRMVPARSLSLEPGLELLPGALQGDLITFQVPAGEFDLFAGSWREGFRTVERGAPGADGPVVDHFSREAVLRYLDRVSGRLVPELGGRLGDHFRAVFCDSLELGEANWTGDFAREFHRRRGYDPMPWLHYMTEPDQPDDRRPGADTLRRLRYDFNLTIFELFQERFIGTLVEWAHANGVKARVQAYGREVHSLESAAQVDLPEGETWIWGGEKTPYPTASNRFTASAAHLEGRRVVSAEAMTNTSTTFRTLPWQLKQTGDLTFLSGVNHFVLHGFNFSPPEAGFPGWVQYGTYFSEHNTWWPYLRRWTDYAARVSWMLQNSVAQGQVAILSPDADVWSDFGRPYYPFPEREAPLYVWRLWEGLHEAGFNTDYISERILLEGRIENGALAYGEQRYPVLISPGLKRVSPAAAERLVEFARGGGRIVFLERFPSQGPSYQDLGPGDATVQSAMDLLRRDFPQAVRQAPVPPDSDRVEWAQQVMAETGLAPDVRFEPASSDVSQIRHRAGSREIFLLVHSGLEEPAEFMAEFPAMAERTAWRWDPETGERSVFPGEGAGRFRIRMEPLESLLLVFEPGSPETGALTWSRPPAREPGQAIEPIWTVRFVHGVTGESWVETLNQLEDMAAAPVPQRQAFSGTITYTAEFEAPGPEWNWLDLGVVHGVSEARLNGHSLGVRWYGRHRYPINGRVQGGANHLEIRVTTHLGNYARSAKDNPAAQRWAHWFPLEPSGLAGPVRLR